MRLFQDISIKLKLMLIILAIAGIALFLSSLALVKFELNTFQKSSIDGLTVQAEIIGNNSAAALTFKDQKAAEEILSALRAAPNVTNAVIYSKDGAVFAKYSRYDTKADFPIPHPQKDNHYLTFDHLDLFHVITLDGEEIGTLYIRSDVMEVYSRLIWYAVTIFVIMGVSLLFAFLMSSRLQGTITVPILDLLEVMNTISKEKKYSLRVSIHSRDEMGALAEGFNHMLSQIQERDTELERHRKHLAEMVAQRTDELVSTNKQLQLELSLRKIAQDSLALEKEQLAVTLSSITDGVITTDTEGHVVLMNKVAEDLTGYSLKEAVGKPLSQVFHIVDERNREVHESPVAKVIETGSTVDSADYFILTGKQGTERNITNTGAPIRNAENRIIGVVVVFRDISEKRKMEEDVLRAQKLESIGVLAGGIAHDFNNLLTAILGNISLAKMHVSPEEKNFQRLTSAETASLRARDLTQQLLTFSKGGAPVKKVMSIAELIKDSVGFALSGSKITCEFAISDDLWAVEIDEGQISQVANNLIINAEQAMPGGGTIKVSCENTTVSEEDALPLKEGRYVQISFEDHGEGISPKYLQRIFDPYFSTKEKGRGLGLATVYSIIRNHDGYVTVESKPGVGTTFKIYLPASESEISGKKIEDEKVLTAKGKILVMDDEEIVRESISEILKYAGYEVEFARDGTEAIEKYTKGMAADEPFDAVVMDLTIPGGMGGKEAIRKLVEIDPKIKAIVSSGYSHDPVMADSRAYGFSAAVSKPYKATEIINVLYDVITRTSE